MKSNFDQTENQKVKSISPTESLDRFEKSQHFDLKVIASSPRAEPKVILDKGAVQQNMRKKYPTFWADQ